MNTARFCAEHAVQEAASNELLSLLVRKLLRILYCSRIIYRHERRVLQNKGELFVPGSAYETKRWGKKMRSSYLLYIQPSYVGHVTCMYL